MKKTLLIFVGILAGISAFGQNTEVKSEVKSKAKSETTTEIPRQQQIQALEDLIKRFGETHEESIKAKSMIATLRKEDAAAEQKRMSETLSPAEYDAWKAKQVAQQNAPQLINKSEDNK